MKMKLSILTATYNRANYLPKLYESIKENLKYKITPEWIIVDDGSTDETKNIVEEFIKENRIIIKYMYQKNSGKMSAINEAVKMATGDLIVDCDSDDYFSDNGFEIIEKNAEKLLKDEELYGMAFLKKEENGKISGKEFSQKEYKTTMLDLYFKEDIGGEKILVYNGKIRKMYSHQLEHNEKFITEARMYHKMDEKYKLLTINEVIEKTAIENGIKYVRANIACTECFDPYQPNRAKGYLSRLPKDGNIVGTEMESFALFYIASKFKRKATCLLSVVDTNYPNKNNEMVVSPEDRQNSLNDMIKLALESTLKI